jgi:hypothetical protein
MGVPDKERGNEARDNVQVAAKKNKNVASQAINALQKALSTTKGL